MEITGKLIKILPAKEGVSQSTGKPWKTQQFVLETQEQYPRKVCFEVFGEDRLNKIQVAEGDDITVSFEVESREYNGRWYTQIHAWEVKNNTGVADTTAQESAQASNKADTDDLSEQVDKVLNGDNQAAQLEGNEPTGQLPF